jgi:hypothetical protein
MDQVRKRRQIVAEQLLKRRTHREIADHIAENYQDLRSVTRQCISLDVKRIRREWRESTLMDFNERKREELEQLELARRKAWEAYERTVGKRRDRRMEGKPTGRKDEKGNEVVDNPKVTITEENLPGDPRLLQVIVNINQQIRELLGLDAPGKSELTGKDGGPIELADAREFILGELARIAERTGTHPNNPEYVGSADPGASL